MVEIRLEFQFQYENDNMHKSYSTLNASSKRPYPIMDFEYGGERKVQSIWSAFPLRPLVQQASQVDVGRATPLYIVMVTMFRYNNRNFITVLLADKLF